jgi:hypothetical protein
LTARSSSSSLRCIALVSRFWVCWMRKTIRKVTIVVPVLITSCQLSEKPKSGPTTAQAMTVPAAMVNAGGLPTTSETQVATFPKYARMTASSIGLRPHAEPLFSR